MPKNQQNSTRPVGQATKISWRGPFLIKDPPMSLTTELMTQVPKGGKKLDIYSLSNAHFDQTFDAGTPLWRAITQEILDLSTLFPTTIPILDDGRRPIIDKAILRFREEHQREEVGGGQLNDPVINLFAATMLNGATFTDSEVSNVDLPTILSTSIDKQFEVEILGQVPQHFITKLIVPSDDSIGVFRGGSGWVDITSNIRDSLKKYLRFQTSGDPVNSQTIGLHAIVMNISPAQIYRIWWHIEIVYHYEYIRNL